MSVSLIVISILILLIMFGAGQKILDNMRLSDKEALIVLIAICIGLLIPPIWIGPYFCFSIGGFLIPFAIVVYLIFSCGWSRDLVRIVFGTLIIGGLIYGLQWILPADPENVVIDNMYIYGIVAGVIAYIMGRSRRNAFVSCLLGLVLADLVQWIYNLVAGTPSILGLGVGGAFSSYIVAIIISVALCEFLGRCFEAAALKKEEKNFNFETHTYDSEKNGKLKNYTNDVVSRLENLSKVKNAKNIKNNKNNALKTRNGGKNAKNN